MNDKYKKLLEEVAAFHGHVCGGIESGVRMSLAGLDRIGIHDPRGADKKKLVVFVEMDRCATDAVMIATGCSPGKRSLKVLDYGKMAATFVNVETRRAVRLAGKPWPNGKPPEVARSTDEELFTIADVEVELRPEDLPGPPVRSCECSHCGERVVDGREILREGKTLCRPCAEGLHYYRAAAAR